MAPSARAWNREDERDQAPTGEVEEHEGDDQQHQREVLQEVQESDQRPREAATAASGLGPQGQDQEQREGWPADQHHRDQESNVLIEAQVQGGDGVGVIGDVAEHEVDEEEERHALEQGARARFRCRRAASS